MKLIAQANQEAPFQVNEGMQRRLLSYGGSLMMAQFSFEAGAAAAWHSHPHEQISYVVSGEIDYCVEGQEPKRLTAGASFYVPPNVTHRVVAYVASVLVDTFTPMRDEFIHP